MKLREKLRENKIYAWIARVIITILLITLIAPSVSNLKVSAAQDNPGETKDILNTIKGSSVSNAYVLETSTGSTAGETIDFCIIRYKDKNNKVRKQYIFPRTDSLSLGYIQAARYSNENAILDDISKKTGYKPNTSYENAVGLCAYQTDQYFFTLPTEIKSVESIDFFACSGGSWSCLAVRLFKVDEIYGLKMAGVWSSEYYIDFKGPLIYAMIDNGQTSWDPKGAEMLHMDEYLQWASDFTGKDYAMHVTQESRTYGFRMDFSDIYKAGIEGLFASYNDGKKSIMELSICEAMTYNITYDDIYGVPRTINIPATTATAYWLSKRNITQPVCGIALQGEDLSFTGEIPDCKTIRDISVSYGPAIAMKDGDFTHSGNFNNRENERERAVSQEAFNISSFAVYDMANTSFNVKVEGAVVKYEYVGNNPILAYVSPNKNGRDFTAGVVTVMGLREYAGQKLDSNEDKMIEGYVFQIQTDNVSIASSRGDLQVVINYVTKGGVAGATKSMSVKDLVNQYWGYWPGIVESSNAYGPNTDAMGENFAYYYGLTKGQTLTFCVELDGVDHFTGVSLSLGETGDEYQFSTFNTYSVTTLGSRKINWEELSSDGVKSRLKYTRTFNSNGEQKDLLDEEAGMAVRLRPPIKETILILPGQTKSIDFITNSIKTLEETGFDIRQYSISYEEAMRNFGFTKSRLTYKVKITVAQDAKVATIGSTTSTQGEHTDSDAGSKNLFYVQLCFADADSAFVLANQQLNGDRFRSGATHEITVYTNQDYGELTAVRIIPDDISSDSDKYDKLNIEKIAVTQGTIYNTVGNKSSGTHKQWECRNVGWIGIDYTDEAAGKGPVAKEGRNMAEIAKTYYVDYITNVVELEFSLMTNRGDKSEEKNPQNGKMQRVYVDQLRGTVNATIYYTDNSGQSRHEDFDVVRAMYEYMGKTVSGEKLVSDTNYMFRESHTDRFFYSIADVKTIQAIDFSVQAVDYNYLWNIGGLTAKIVEERGNLRLNAFDEFEYEYPGVENPEEAIVLTASNKNQPVADAILTQTEQTIHIPVDCSEIKVEDQSGFQVVAYDRIPLTGRDELNVYVFPSQGVLADPISEYDLNCVVQYVHPVGMYFVEEETMRKREADEEAGTRAMFYTIGLKANNMIDLNRITLKAKSLKANMCVLDYAIVQQVRAGTIVATYYIDLDKREASVEGVIAFPNGKQDVLGYTEEQTVTVQLGAGTVAKGLYAERSDIGFAIEYTSIFDPYGPSYRSPITYFTDEEINRIKEGQVADLHFNQVFVGRVTGLYGVATGDVQATVDKAVIANYRKDVGDYKVLDSWYSFGTGATLDNSLTGMFQTASEITSPDSIMPVQFTIKTSDAATGYESGTRDPVEAVIYKTDWDENVSTELIPDLRKYIVGTDTNFLTGKTQTVRMLLTGAAGVRRISIEPKKGDMTGGWSIDTITCKVGDNDPIERTVGYRIYEGDPKEVIFTNVTLNTTVQYYNISKNAYDQQRVTNNTLSVISPNKQVVYITPSVVGSEYGFSIKACEITSDGYEGADMSSKLSGPNAGRYVFNPGENTSGKQKYYRITVTSEETKEAKVIINITVESADETAIAEKAAQDAAELVLNRQAYDAYRSERGNAAQSEGQPGDSAACGQIIDGYASKMKSDPSLSYDAGKTLAENKARIDAVYSQMMAELDAQRKKDAQDAANEAEYNAYVSQKFTNAKAQADALGKEDDSDACKNLITKAKADIDSYSDSFPTFSKDVSLDDQKATVDSFANESFPSIISSLETQLTQQRAYEEEERRKQEEEQQQQQQGGEGGEGGGNSEGNNGGW